MTNNDILKKAIDEEIFKVSAISFKDRYKAMTLQRLLNQPEVKEKLFKDMVKKLEDYLIYGKL